MIRLTGYIVLCILASLVVALPTLALADDILTPIHAVAYTSTLPSLNDMSIPQEPQDGPGLPTTVFNPPPIVQQAAQAEQEANEQVAAASRPMLAPIPAIATQRAAPAAVISVSGPQIQPQASLDDVPAFNVSYGDIETAVSQALTEKGAGEKISATINGRSDKPVFAFTRPMTLQIRGLTYDKVSGHWSANVLAMSGEEVVSAQPTAGHFDAMVEVPVLKHAVRTGEIISESDIAIHDFPIVHVHSDAVTDIANLIGKTPLRGISPLRPIRMEEVVEPALIKKNAVISMRYAMDGMLISASGQAMEDGTKGSLIAVRNMDSKKIIRAVVQDAMTVNVAPVDAAQAFNVEPQGAQAHATN